MIGGSISGARGVAMLSSDEVARFDRDGFLILRNFLDRAQAARLAARFEGLFAGHFPTGLHPDEWNWRATRDPPDRTRQICNGWKSDPAVAAAVLSPAVGQASAQLGRWPGARIAQDNVLWKPPGAKPLGFHQDDSYIDWVQPAAYVTCWMALDDTSAAGGTIEYVRGSHRWGLFPPIAQFHAPDDYRKELAEAAAQVGQVPEIVHVEVPAGGCALHHGATWHGSGVNRGSSPRRSVVAHCISSEARFHPTNVSPVYSRYRRVADTTMDESFFPILWRQDGYRTPWLDSFIAQAA
ncbi:phytanoyl-CoA dioxygenase family protein [Zavarzinia sp. CC-PAN008]|uniref:phytanoyl-CoA dioxygenase family protein n=1 Tax=Zavarzinia sp. CC-PAN008 TaxID=3243332 RepID=UPI003F74287E